MYLQVMCELHSMSVYLSITAGRILLGEEKEGYRYSPSSILLNVNLAFGTRSCYLFDGLCTGRIFFLMAC